MKSVQYCVHLHIHTSVDSRSPAVQQVLNSITPGLIAGTSAQLPVSPTGTPYFQGNGAVVDPRRDPYGPYGPYSPYGPYMPVPILANGTVVNSRDPNQPHPFGPFLAGSNGAVIAPLPVSPTGTTSFAPTVFAPLPVSPTGAAIPTSPGVNYFVNAYPGFQVTPGTPGAPISPVSPGTAASVNLAPAQNVPVQGAMMMPYTISSTTPGLLFSTIDAAGNRI